MQFLYGFDFNSDLYNSLLDKFQLKKNNKTIESKSRIEIFENLPYYSEKNNHILLLKTENKSTTGSALRAYTYNNMYC